MTISRKFLLRAIWPPVDYELPLPSLWYVAESDIEPEDEPEPPHPLAERKVAHKEDNDDDDDDDDEDKEKEGLVTTKGYCEGIHAEMKNMRNA
jgi:hypothetical protein